MVDNNCATYMIIAAPKLMNSFMVAADLFEHGKVLGETVTITVHYKAEVNLTLQRAAEAINHFKNAYEANGHIISLVHLLYVERGNIIERNIGLIQPYINLEVRIVSTGRKWFLLDDLLRSLGWKVETDEHRFIKAVS